MSMTEQGTQMTQSAMIEVSKTSAKLSVNLAGTSAHAVASMLGFAATALHNSRNQHKNKPGQTTISRLQERVDGDVHAQSLDPSLETTLRQELNSRGINFAIEHAPDGQTYVHFAGKDLHALEHAVTQTEARLGIDGQTDTHMPNQEHLSADSTATPTMTGTESPTVALADPVDPLQAKLTQVGDTTPTGSAKPLHTPRVRHIRPRSRAP